MATNQMIRTALGRYAKAQVSGRSLAATIAWAIEAYRVVGRRVEVDDASEAGEAADAVLFKETVVQPVKFVDAVRSNLIHMLCALAEVPEDVACQVVEAVNSQVPARVAA